MGNHGIILTTHVHDGFTPIQGFALRVEKVVDTAGSVDIEDTEVLYFTVEMRGDGDFSLELHVVNLDVEQTRSLQIKGISDLLKWRY